MAEISKLRPAATYSPQTIGVIGLCFVFSGATGLIYEVLWARMLGLVFGATTLAVSTVLAAFMGGLAFGSAIAGRLAKKIDAPLRTYGRIEIGIAIYALLVPLLFRSVDYVYAAVWQHFQPGFFAFSVWRFILSCLLLLVPTTLMGATLPVLSAALLHSARNQPKSIARLYMCNLTGAVIGTISAGFVLLPTIGVRATIAVAAIINVIIGLTAMVMERRSKIDSDEVAAEAFLSVTYVDTNSRRFWFFCAFASGFVTISTQVSWTRILTMIIGSSTYAFSIVVALFLIGLSIGAWLVERSLFATKLRATILKLEILTALSILFSLVMVNWIPAMLVNLGLKLQLASWLGLVALQIMSATLLILLPAVLMGMVMPMVLVWAGKSSESITLVARSYAINTIGAIVGAFMTGFVLIPNTSTRFTILFAAALSLVVAGIAYKPSTGKDVQLKRSLGMGVTVAAVILLFLLAPKMNLADLSIGAYDSLIRVLAQSREGIKGEDEDGDKPNTHKLLMYREGPTATVSVRDDRGTISMAINGRTNASDSPYDMPTQVMLAQLPMLIAPRIDKGLVVGFATGVTAGAMLQSPIEELTCVELESATVDGSHFFDHVNNKPLNDSRFRLVIDDARTYLRVTPHQFDVIVSEPNHPWVPGVANLFTREFFELGRDRLSDQGVFVQWLQIYQLSTESLRSILATYQKVFPHVLVFRVGGTSRGKDLILLGATVPLDLSRIHERLGNPLIAAELSRVDLKSAGDVQSWFVCDEIRLGPAVAGAKINTDDNMHIETQVPREAFRPLMQGNAEWVQSLAN